MILVDANLLLYAYDSESPLHARAKRWVEEMISSGAAVALCGVTLLAFLRVSTNPRVMKVPLAMSEALTIVSLWLRQPSVVLLEPGERYWEILARLCAEGQVRGPLVMDAHLATLAVEHGAVLCTTDRDFGRFRSLRVRNPLEETAP